MPHVALVHRGRVVQSWHNAHARDIDASRLTGSLVEHEGEPALEGMSFRDGRFWTAPSRPSAEMIRAEADRRTHTVFPAALAELIASQGGEFAAVMTRYLHDVRRAEAEFLALDAAPPDFRDDAYWPAAPDASRASLPVPIAAPRPVVATAQPLELRVVMEHPTTATRLIEAQPVDNRQDRSGSTRIDDLRLAAIDALDRLAEAHGHPAQWRQEVAPIIAEAIARAQTPHDIDTSRSTLAALITEGL